MNPGDTRALSRRRANSCLYVAQRRPRHEPRRHSVRRTSADSQRWVSSLNEGRGMNPGDTQDARQVPMTRSRSTLNEGRGMNPGDTSTALVHACNSTGSPLNEGRGMNPGDTRRPTSPGPVLHHALPAQRRPRHEPRRHEPVVRPQVCRDPQSRGAQRRPRHEPRRHCGRALRAHCGTMFAQRRPRHEPRRHPARALAPATL